MLHKTPKKEWEQQETIYHEKITKVLLFILFIVLPVIIPIYLTIPIDEASSLPIYLLSIIFFLPCAIIFLITEYIYYFSVKGTDDTQLVGGFISLIPIPHLFIYWVFIAGGMEGGFDIFGSIFKANLLFTALLFAKNIFDKKRKVPFFKKETVIITTICMVYDNDQILVQENTDGKQKRITFPTGQIKRRECLTDSVIREVLNATGLTISAPKLCEMKDWFASDGTRYIRFFYKTNQYSGEIKTQKGERIYWTPISILPTLPLGDDTDDILRVYFDHSYPSVK